MSSEPVSNFQRDIQDGKFVITAEIGPPKASHNINFFDFVTELLYFNNFFKALPPKSAWRK